MSRSFKHNGFIQDQSSKKHGKRFSNKRVRRSNDVVSGSNYKKIYNSWDIADYKLSCRGKRISVSVRPGRRNNKIEFDPSSPWNNETDNLYKDWRK